MSSRIVFIVRILAATLLLLLGYYLLILSPRLFHPVALISTERQIGAHYGRLLENRLSLVATKNINPLSPRVTLQKERRYELIQKTSEDEINSIDSAKPLSPLVDKEIVERYKSLLERTRALLEKEREMVEPLKNLDSVVENIFLYIPEKDLETDDREQLTSRATEAIKGLETIEKNLSSVDFEAALGKKILNELQKTKEEFGKLARGGPKTPVISQFNRLKETTLNAQIEYLQSDKNVEIITELSNIVLEYSFLLSKINERQKSLNFP